MGVGAGRVGSSSKIFPARALGAKNELQINKTKKASIRTAWRQLVATIRKGMSRSSFQAIRLRYNVRPCENCVSDSDYTASACLQNNFASRSATNVAPTPQPRLPLPYPE